MSHASTSAKSDSSDASGPWSLRMGAYSYQIARTQDGISYSVTDGSRTLSSALAWVFGSGHFGQTYVYEQKGVFYESHLSYFQGIHGLDLTTGHRQMEIPDLDHSWGVRSLRTRSVAALVATQPHPPRPDILIRLASCPVSAARPAMGRAPSTSRRCPSEGRPDFDLHNESRELIAP